MVEADPQLAQSHNRSPIKGIEYHECKQINQ